MVEGDLAADVEVAGEELHADVDPLTVTIITIIINVELGINLPIPKGREDLVVIIKVLNLTGHLLHGCNSSNRMLPMDLTRMATKKTGMRLAKTTGLCESDFHPDCSVDCSIFLSSPVI